MDFGEFVRSLCPCLNRRTFGKHGCLKCGNGFNLNDFDQNMRSFRNTNAEESIEKNLIGSRTCFSTDLNANADEQIEESKWSQIIARTIGPSNKAAWMITATFVSSHQPQTKTSKNSIMENQDQDIHNQASPQGPPPHYSELNADGLPSYGFLFKGEN